MQNLFENYIQSISSKFSHEETSEIGYRTDFEILIKGIFESINVKRIDHDAKAEQGNKPDFVVLNHDIPILYIETKNIGVSLDKIEKSEQMARYYGYANLVLTDYVEFRFYRNGLRYEEPIKIGVYDIKNRTITPIPKSYDHVAKTFIDFTQSHKEPIKSGKHLSKIMGGKAQRIRDNVRQFLATESDKNVELVRVYETIKKLLVHDLTRESFADMYAQTLVYGLFVARYYDETPDNFTRGEARELIPKSNPLLRHFFDHIVGPDFDKRLEYIVNELCKVFSHADIPELMKEYFKNDLWGETHKGPDPVIHFYEDFLKEYDDDLRKKMGAYYTPLPIVQFIVRSVDYLLEKEFGLMAGLADISKTITGIHRVQILDPAVGTGTFISDVIGKIYTRILKDKQEGRWPTYVHNDLLPRLHGFELMMAPYTIAHLKLGMAFRKTGFKYFNQRLGIYLTNSLEESAVQQDLFTGFGFAESIAEESKEATKIKNEKPIMIVVGNPPYSGVSMNKQYKDNNVYKVELGGRQKLKEKKNWLNDDYVKFIRFAESLIEKNQEGIIGMVTSHGYIDNPTFRGMRWHLRKTFDVIYVLDLHGNSNKKEISPDGSKDENVFDIKTGVAIILGIKKQSNTTDKKPALVYQADLYGTRENKFEKLNKENIDSIKWNKLPEEAEIWKVEGKGKNEYKKGFSVTEIFSNDGLGIVTARDEFTIDFEKESLHQRMIDFMRITAEEARQKYKLRKDVQAWKVSWAQNDVKKTGADIDNIKEIQYRIFDKRYIYYTKKSSGILVRPSGEVMQNFINNKNVGLVTSRQVKAGDWCHVILSDNIIESSLVSNKTGEICSIFPLYIYVEDGTKVPNFKREIVNKIEEIVGKISPEDIFDYIYAFLHSPNYREKYKEFLKIDFPRVPYPKNKKQFFELVRIGTELRELHLMESKKLEHLITTYSETGDDKVEKVEYKDGKVFINKMQYFGGVPDSTWNFSIGGYQPAQKWLKDRKGRILTNADIEHYQKIIIALLETDKLMKEIDEIK